MKLKDIGFLKTREERKEQARTDLENARVEIQRLIQESKASKYFDYDIMAGDCKIEVRNGDIRFKERKKTKEYHTGQDYY